MYIYITMYKDAYMRACMCVSVRYFVSDHACVISCVGAHKSTYT